jgi:putative DNA primase/helicase
MQADKLAIRRFIQVVHGAEPRGWLALWTRQDKVTRAFDLTVEKALDQAVDYCAACALQQDVYVGNGLQAEQPRKGSRGKEDRVISVPGVWADIDIAGEAHKSKELPPTERAAVQLMDSVGLLPSIIVRSGFGLQPHWLFREPFFIESEAERQNLKSLSRRFQQILRIQATACNWILDATADLNHLVRLPGTLNRKILGDIRLITAEYFDHRYLLDDLEEAVSGIDDPNAPNLTKPACDLPPAKLPPILNGCAWMRHCRDDASTLPEPEWYQMLTVVARCRDAEEWAHKLSETYPGYSRRETTKKLKQATGSKIAPVTCAYVESNLTGYRYCAECLFRGNVNSPITIGRLDTVEAREGLALEQRADATTTAVDLESSSATALVANVERFTDLGNARRFVARFRNQLLYCEKWTRWLVWDGRRWKEDETLEVYRLAGSLIRSLYALAKRISNEDKREAFLAHLSKSESYRSLTAMLNLARADSQFAVHPSDLDRDPWLLTVENGTFDLGLGKLRPQNQADRITKLAPIIYDPSATCPNWLHFMDMVMNQNAHLVSFLKRAFGSCLTGITSDKALYILHGPSGDNGTSTMVDVIQLLLGDYAIRTPVETFMRKKEGAIPNDVAKLKGARFVWASENERGSWLSESLIKEMTGGDKLSARFMRGEFFEFYPEFKPWLATNHKPQVRGDRALWNRVKLIPFTVTIPPDKQKPRHEVMEMFRAEFSGILNWLVEGCLEWQKSGLGVPDEVVEATREYEVEQDTFGGFLEEKCILVASAQALSGTLYRIYRPWAEEHGETPVSHKTFSSLMAERGFAKTKTRNGALYSGIGLRSEDHYDTAPARTVAGEDQLEREQEGEEV